MVKFLQLGQDFFAENGNGSVQKDKIDYDRNHSTAKQLHIKFQYRKHRLKAKDTNYLYAVKMVLFLFLTLICLIDAMANLYKIENFDGL